MSDTNQERKAAVREAWKIEKASVREGKGTRDWTQSEQREIVAKGQAKGYEGHHMKSVKDYPRYAGDPHNIQFLSRTDHIMGAHKGDTKNSTNGYYDSNTGTMHGFGNHRPQAPQSNALSSPLTQRQQSIAIKREEARKQAAKQARAEKKIDASKTVHSNDQTKSHGSQSAAQSDGQPRSNKGIESMRKQSATSATASSGQTSGNKGIASARQRATSTQASTTSSANKGISNFQGKTGGVTSTPSSGSKGSAHASGSSNGSSSSNSNSSGQGR